MITQRILVTVVLLVFSLMLASPVFAQDYKTEDLFLMSLEELLNIDITTASKTRQKESEAPSIVTVISAEEIKNMGAENIMQVLNTVVSFDILRENLPIKTIGVRGIKSQMGDQKVKLMLNGHSLQILFGSLAYNNYLIPLDIIKQIEIIRGPGSALYGENAFTGVINIVTKDVEESSTVSLRGGSYNTIQPIVNFNYKNEDFEFSIYGDYFSSDGSEVAVEKDAAYTLFGENYSLSPGKIDSRRKQAHIRAFAKYKDFYYSNYYDHMINSGADFGVGYCITDDNELNLLNFLQEIGYNHHFSENLTLSAKSTFDFCRDDIKLEVYDEKTTPVFSAMHPDAEPFPDDIGLIIWSNDFDLLKAGAEISLDYKPSPVIQIISGALYEYFELSNAKFKANGNVSGKPFILDGVTYLPLQYLGGIRDVSDVAHILEPTDRTITAFYIQGTIDAKKLSFLKNIGNALTFTVGARYDNYDDVGSSTNPRAGLVYAPTNNLYFKALYGKAFRAPSFLDLYTKNSGSFEGNPDLEPEEMTTMEGMIGFNFSKNLRASLAVYNNKAVNIIKGVSSEMSGMYFDNVGDIDVTGIEFELKTFLARNKYGYLNFTFLDSKNTTNETITYTEPNSGDTNSYSQEDYKMGTFPDFMLNAGLNYDIKKNIIANLNLNYRGRRERSEEKTFDSNGNLTDIDQRESMDAVIILNGALTFKGFGSSFEGLSSQISAYNFLDTNYSLPDDTAQLTDDFQMEGARFMLKISYNF